MIIRYQKQDSPDRPAQADVILCTCYLRKGMRIVTHPRMRMRNPVGGAYCRKMADSSGAVDKPLLAFLNGISKRQYFGEDDITDEFLREEILGNMAEEGA